MKFTVSTNVVSLLVIFGLFALSAEVAADNSCDCQSPPGGTVRCEQGQIPFCWVKDGKIIAVCKSPPRSAMLSKDAYELWVASEALGVKLEPADLNRPEIKEALVTGIFKKTYHEMLLDNQKSLSLEDEGVSGHYREKEIASRDHGGNKGGSDKWAGGAKESSGANGSGRDHVKDAAGPKDSSGRDKAKDTGDRDRRR